MAKKVKKSKEIKPTLSIVDVIINGIEEKKGSNIHVIDLTKIPQAICDYFIICDGNSNSQVSAIAESVEEQVRIKLGEKPWHREGLQNAEWVLVDFVNVVVHIFQKETREFYNLEDVWADAPVKVIETKN